MLHTVFTYLLKNYNVATMVAILHNNAIVSSNLYLHAGLMFRMISENLSDASRGNEIYEHDEFHKCLKIDLVAYAINNIRRRKNILQTFKLHNFIKVLSLSCLWTLRCQHFLVF